jgi:hypothetical protein
MGLLAKSLPMTQKSITSFKTAYQDGSMESLSVALNRQFGAVLKECSDVTKVNPLLAAILIYIEGKPNGKKAWLESEFTGYSPENPDNGRYIGISQVDVKTAAYVLFIEYRNSALTDTELVFMKESIGNSKTTQLYDKIKLSKKQASPSDWLATSAKKLIYDGLYQSTSFNMLIGQIYFGQCLDKHAGIASRYDKAYYAYNQGINTKFPITTNTDALLEAQKQANGLFLKENGKNYILKSVGLHSPFWFLESHFN